MRSSLSLTRAVMAAALPLALLLLAAVAAPAAADEAAPHLHHLTHIEPTPFAADKYLEGEWEVFRHLVRFVDSAVIYEHSLPPFRWRLDKENSTAHLSGPGWVNGSSAEEASLALRVEFSEPSQGKLQTGPNEDDLSTLAQLHFTQMAGSVAISVGEWHGAEVGPNGGNFVFQLASPDRFTILVTPKGGRDLAAAAKLAAKLAASSKAQADAQGADEDDDDELSASGPASTGHPALSLEDLEGHDAYLYVGHRHKVEVEKTFMQRWGTMLALGGMLLLNIWMRTRQSGQQIAARQATDNVLSAAAAQRMPERKKGSGVKIEEVIDEPAKKEN